MRGAKAGQQHLTSHVHRVDALDALVGPAAMTDGRKNQHNHKREKRALGVTAISPKPRWQQSKGFAGAENHRIDGDVLARAVELRIFYIWTRGTSNPESTVTAAYRPTQS